MTELDKLENYLNEKGIEHHRHDEKGPTFETSRGWKSFDRHQIVVEENGEYLWDAICHYGSYGYEEGLLEVMGEYLIGHGDVEGYLTADEVIKMIEEER